uniref:Uncharacterized protein n=1 Tax=Timema douglasi TaxID=61478 RepID=A0A7R8VEZ2_TIMDO|nr:unnamed protein product [Timema douglasi]
MYPHFCGRRTGNHVRKIALNTPDRNSNSDFPVIGNPVYCKSDVLDHVACKIWEYNDVNDTGYLNMSLVNKNYKRAYDTEYFHWKIAKFENDTEGAILHMESAKYNKPGDVTAVEKGNIKFMLASLRYYQVKTANVEEWGDDDLRSPYSTLYPARELR